MIKLNKIPSQYIITASVVFNVKSMNNIENIKNFDKIKLINNIEDQLKESNSVINKLTENIFLESLHACDFSKIKKVIVDNGRCKIEDGELSYNGLQYLQYKNNIDFYKNNIYDIFEGKSLFFYQINDYFLQYVQLNLLNTIFNINSGNNIFRKLLNIHLNLFKDNKYFFYDFLDEIASKEVTNLKIENILNNIDEYLKNRKCIEDSYLSSDFFKKNDKIVAGLTYNHNKIISLGVIQGLTYCKKNLLFEYLDKTHINGFYDLTSEIVINDVIFNNLQILDKDLSKNINNINKYVFLYQSIKNFIDVNIHEFDHFMYFIYQDIFNYYSNLNTNESIFLDNYKEFYNIFNIDKILNLNDENTFENTFEEFSLFLNYYFNNNDLKNKFTANVYKIKILTLLSKHNENYYKIGIFKNDKRFYSTYSFEDHDIKEFFAEIFSKYMVSNINNDFIMELLKIRYFYCFYQIILFSINSNSYR